MRQRSEKINLLIYGIFFASGISGLIYEVVWLRMLSRIIGVTTYATATVLAAFMAGLALGSFLFGMFIDRRKKPLQVYALLEFAVALAALLVPIIFSISMPLFKYVYQTSGESLSLTTAARAIITFLTLLIPTTLMGGTLPILTSWLVRKEAVFGRSFALLYGINTFGAVAGVILSGFITIGAFGEQVTIFIGVLINILVAAVAFTIAWKKETPPFSEEAATIPGKPRRAILPYATYIRRVVLMAFAVSGFTALAYEVIWTRQLILFLATSIYAFSGMLAVFLCGVALGSIYMKNIVDGIRQPLVILGVFELLVGLLSLINLYLFPLFESQFAIGLLGESRVLLATLIIVFPITFIFGMIFPTAGVCYTKDLAKTGHSVGWLYSANTVGSILGSLLTGFWLIPRWGSAKAVVLLACINFFLGLLLLALVKEKSTLKKLSYLTLTPIFIILTLAVTNHDLFLSTIEARIARDQVTESPGKSGSSHIYYNREGIEGTVTAFSLNDVKHLWINGIGMTFLCTETKLMAHLPLMYCPNAKDFLIICFGMGTTTRSAALYPHLKITAVDLVPELYNTFKYFHDDAPKVLEQKNVNPVANDGRHFLLWASQKFDVITVDPAPPIWSAGTVNLYSQEFFELCKDKLSPRGVMCLWFPGFTTKEEVQSVLKTFHAVFPHTVVYSGPRQWGFYFIGMIHPISDHDLRHNVELAFQNPLMVKDLEEFDKSCHTPAQLHGLMLANPKEVEVISRNGALITDDYPYTEFFLWRYLFKGRKFWRPDPAAYHHPERSAPGNLDRNPLGKRDNSG